MRISVLLSSVLLFLVSIIHFLRLIFKLKVVVEGYVVPMWMSIPAFLITLFLSIFLIIDEKKRLCR